MFEEVYYTEVSFDNYEVLIVDTKNKTYTIKNKKEKELKKDFIFMSKEVFDSLLIGLKENKFKKI